MKGKKSDGRDEKRVQAGRVTTLALVIYSAW